jgi:hypothetical protein
MIARGVVLGADQPVILHMLDIPPAAEALNGVKMELVDAAFPLLKGMFRLFYLSNLDDFKKHWYKQHFNLLRICEIMRSDVIYF